MTPLNTDSNLLLEQITLWLIDDDPALRLILADAFSDAQITVVSFTQAQAAWTRLNDILKEDNHDDLPNVILTDIRMPLMDGLSFSDWVHKSFPDLPVIIMTAHSDLQSAVDSYQTGAFDYLPKPFDLDDAIAIVKKAVKPPAPPPHPEITSTSLSPFDHGTNTSLQSDNHHKTDSANLTATKAPNCNQPAFDDTVSSPDPLNRHTLLANHSNGIIGQSTAMQSVFRAIGRLSHSPITVLITGESGTGKELVANALHQHSPRKNRPFIALNMAAIPQDLIESELFGHEKGAFTGATTARQGRFEQADGGSLFLDEIGDMPFSTQTRLLRVLANGEFYRVGGQKPIKVDVRIIAATHQNLENLVKLGKFREDLFYRLNVIRLPLPPLRERREDIPDLVTYFMHRAALEMNTKQKLIHPDALAMMQAFDWPGNVRQIENVCRWLTVMATGDTVLTEDLPPELIEYLAQSPKLASLHPHTDHSSDLSPTLPPNHLDANISLSSIANSSATPITTHSPITDQLATATDETTPTWQQALEDWARLTLASGKTAIFQSAASDFEQVLLKVALSHTNGKKGEAAQLLGWGRNTISRKLKQLDIK